jgi:predicted naringenin-chalcone synthase
MKSATSSSSYGFDSFVDAVQQGVDHVKQVSSMHETLVRDVLGCFQPEATSPTSTNHKHYVNAIQLLGIGTYSPQLYTQEEVLDMLGYKGHKLAEIIVKNAAIHTRSFSQTTRDFGTDVSAEELAAYHRIYAPRLAAAALHAAAGDHFDLTQLDAIITTTSTGFMSPGIAEVLFETDGIGRPDTNRYNLVGNGCVGSIPTLQMAQSLLHSGQARYVAVVFAEAVAALFNPRAEGKMAIIQQLIFGEGGAAMILGKPPSPLPQSSLSPYPLFLDSYQELAPHSLDSIAIRQGDYWESVTDKTIPEQVSRLVPKVVEGLLRRHNLTIDDIPHWAFHTGGRKILEVCQSCLGLSDEQMQPSYEVLFHHGNMLSASVIFTFDRVLRNRTPMPGDKGVMLALGPGMTGGAFLLEW